MRREKEKREGEREGERGRDREREKEKREREREIDREREKEREREIQLRDIRQDRAVKEFTVSVVWIQCPGLPFSKPLHLPLSFQPSVCFVF